MGYKKRLSREAKIGLKNKQNKTIQDLRKGTPPLTSELQGNKTRAEINKLNRQRSAAMESRIAKVLGGRRTPSSGAMAKYKGDVEVPLKNYPGSYLIECKLSAQESRGKATLHFEYDWLPKIELEAKNMNMKFSALIIHFQGNNNDYVFISEKTMQLFITRYNSQYAELIKGILALPSIDWRTGKKSKYLLRDSLEDSLTDVLHFRAMRVDMEDQGYVITTLNTFKSIVQDL